MAKEAASLCLLFLSFLIIFCSAGTPVGFSYLETGNTALSTSAGATFLQKNKISQSQIRFYATDPKILSLVENFISSKSCGVSWVKAHLVTILPQVDIRSIIASCECECLGQNKMPLLVSTLESIHSALSKLQLGREVKVSVAFPVSFLENLNPSQENDLRRILWFIKKINSFIMIEDNMDGESSMGVHHFVQSVIKRATLAASILPCKDVPVVVTIKSQVIPSSIELSQFSEAASKYLEAKSQITKGIVALALYVELEIHTSEGFVQKELKREEGEGEIFPLLLRENLSIIHTRRSLEDTNNSPTPVFPTNPASTTPAITPPDTPTIITVPSTNPVTVSPTNPAATPVTVPSTTPNPLPPSNPANSPPVPVTAPITVPGAQPGTNPVASYPPPSPSGSVPLMMPPPANTSTQATPGQSWCVAKTGVSETVLQTALDYACGTAGADCSQIQQGGSCYNPNSLQNHASVAFNSYYQKNPAPTSCDFGGTATIVSTNPSSGTCIYPSSSSGAGTSGSGTTPPSDSGSQSPPDFNASRSTGLRPFLGCMVLVISLVSGRLSMSL